MSHAFAMKSAKKDALLLGGSISWNLLFILASVTPKLFTDARIYCDNEYSDGL